MAGVCIHSSTLGWQIFKTADSCNMSTLFPSTLYNAVQAIIPLSSKLTAFFLKKKKNKHKKLFLLHAHQKFFLMGSLQSKTLKELYRILKIKI